MPDPEDPITQLAEGVEEAMTGHGQFSGRCEEATLTRATAPKNYFVSAEGFGECELLVRRGNHFEDELVVVRADPRILVTAGLLDEARRAAGMSDEFGWPSLVTLKGDILTLNGVNQKVIYRIGDYLAQPDCYVAEWPD